jgi:hypothetical protein
MPEGFFGTGITLAAYGDALAAVGRNREAERALTDAYDILLPAMGADNKNVARCATSLATLYEKAGRAGDATLWRSRIVAGAAP